MLTFLEVSFLVSAIEALPIKGDAVQLQHVILNMIVNGVEAISAIRYGCAVIGRIELNGGSSAIVSISGSGPGTSPEKLTEVFDPFFITKQQGMGMELSFARSNVQAHKGRIRAENHPEGRSGISQIAAGGGTSGGEVGADCLCCR